MRSRVQPPKSSRYQACGADAAIDCELTGADLRDIAALHEVWVREHVLLRPLRKTDGPALLAILENDPTIRKRVGFAATVNSQADYLAQLKAIAADPGLIRYGIHERGRLVGMVSLWRDEGFFGQEPERGGYGFGFFLDETARGRGLMTNSVAALMNCVEANVKVRMFLAFCEDDNQASKAVLAKLGFSSTDEVFGESSHGWKERKYLAHPKTAER